MMTTLNNENEKSQTVIYPKDTSAFSFQVAGHKHGQGNLKLGVLKHKNGNIIKPLLEGDQRAIQEVSFYENIAQNYEFDPLLKEIKSYLPEFHGIWETSIAGKGIKYLCLEDVCSGFQKPSILDIKMGCKTYDRRASAKKILEETSKFLYGKITGIRILGMKVYNMEKDDYFAPEKSFFKKLSAESMIPTFEMYLTKEEYINIWLLCGFVHKLQQLDVWFSKQRKFEFIGSSILFIYEGNLSHWSTWSKDNSILQYLHYGNATKMQDSECDKSSMYEAVDTCDICGLCKATCCKILENCPLYRVSMIDFAHVYPSDQEDTNYIFGLRNLLQYFKDLLKSQIAKSCFL